MTIEYDSKVKKNENCHETWVSCKDEYPEEGRNVILWRHGQKCYTIACIENSIDGDRWGLKHPEKIMSKKWRSHRANAMKLNEKDFWRYFPYI